MSTVLPVWKSAPFLRLLIPFIIGIIFQVYAGFPVIIPVISAGVCCVLFIIVGLMPITWRYKLDWLRGILIQLILIAAGILLAWNADIRNDPEQLINKFGTNDLLVVTLTERPIEKPASWKAKATVNHLIRNGHQLRASGDMLLYFSKDSLPVPAHGSRLVIAHGVVPIMPTGNPGAFDFREYSLRNGISHQAFLKRQDYIVDSISDTKWFTTSLLAISDRVLYALRSFIPGEQEQGLAEALLIGYKHDLDKDLVQSYSSTGVVHIIAISGMHLGLIYWILVVLLRPLKKNRSTRMIRTVLIIAGLWIFSILAGAQASILRSALMFTCIVIGENFGRRSNIFNSLALSAFLLLCYNPFWLWDAGFQLSYCAVLSIVLFMKPVYNLLYFPNKLVDMIWQLNAVTISAQILTIPICLYHFHQFPVYFILSNLVAVPLSSIILFAEIGLCVISFWEMLAKWLGRTIAELIGWMNGWIQLIEKMPFAVWEGIQINTIQAAFLYVMLLGIIDFFRHRRVRSLQLGLGSLFIVMGLRSYSFYQAGIQSKMIVYNISRKDVMELVSGRSYQYIGDTTILHDRSAYLFNIAPSHTLHRVAKTPAAGTIFPLKAAFNWKGQSFLVIDGKQRFTPTINKLQVDFLILTGKPQINPEECLASVEVRQVIAAPTISRTRSEKLRSGFLAAQVPYHDVKRDGAFVIHLP